MAKPESTAETGVKSFVAVPTKKRKPSLGLFLDGAHLGKETKVAEKLVLWTLHKRDGSPEAYHNKRFLDNVEGLISPLGGDAVKRNMFWISQKPETWPRFLTKHAHIGGAAVTFEEKEAAKGMDPYYVKFTPDGLGIIRAIEADEKQVEYFERKRMELIVPAGDKIHTTKLKKRKHGVPF